MKEVKPTTDSHAQGKGYKGVGMEGRMATWYAKNTAKDMVAFQLLADEISRQIPASAKVLEVAPGPGYLAIELAKRGNYEITGLDISKTFVQIATDNARTAGVKVDFQYGNASAMPFTANSFDFIVCRAAFKNFSNPIEAINEMHRALRPGGRAVIIDLRKDASMDDINTYIKSTDLSWKDQLIYKLTFRYLLIPRAYSKKQFADMVSASTFEACEIKESGIGFEIHLTK